jgi:ABC-2 type transport system ATP-binding protein
LLDEPSSGLDPLVRKDILNAIVKVVSDEGRTVIFSSHLLDEIEMMSDYLLMLQQGRLVMFGELDGIKEKHHAVSARWPERIAEPILPEARSVERIGNDWWLVLEGSDEQIRESVIHSGGEILSCRNASLQEIFTSRARLQHLAIQPRVSIQPQLSSHPQHAIQENGGQP